jgi:hypothetical protein
MISRSVGGDIGAVPGCQNDGNSIADHNGRVHRSLGSPFGQMLTQSEEPIEDMEALYHIDTSRRVRGPTY